MGWLSLWIWLRHTPRCSQIPTHHKPQVAIWHGGTCENWCLGWMVQEIWVCMNWGSRVAPGGEVWVQAFRSGTDAEAMGTGGNTREGKWWVSKVPANELPNFEKQLFKHIQTYSNINKPTIGFGVWGISGLCLIRGRVGLGWLRDIKGINWNCAHDSYSISAGRGSSSSTDSRKMAWISTCTYTVTT